MTDVCGKPRSMPADNDNWTCTECGYIQPGPHKDDCVCRPGPTVDEVLAGWIKDLDQVVSSMNRDKSYTRAHEAQTLLMQIDHWRDDLGGDWSDQKWEDFKNMPVYADDD